MLTRLLVPVLFSITWSFPIAPLAGQVHGGLRVEILNEPPTRNIIAGYDGFDTGGNTSVAFDAEDIFKWSGNSAFRSEGWGYFDQDGREIPYIKRDRDLGQTFRHEDTAIKRIRSVTVSTGLGTNVVRPEMYNKRISIQFFEVHGEPAIHDNGSGPNIQAFHGFPHNRIHDSIPHYRDDYLMNENYTSIATFTGATFPSRREFGFVDTLEIIPPDHSLLKSRLLRFYLPETSRVRLEPGRRYAFLIMIDEMDRNTGFTLANHYWGSYANGHAIRRDGNGQFPPVPANPSFGFHAGENNAAMESAHFPNDFNVRTSISPGTNGYPDVDTFRDLLFYIEAD